MPVWRVLAIDDDKDRLDEISQIFAGGVDDSTFEFTLLNSFAEGLESISTNRYDLVILDVHEDGSDADPTRNLDTDDQMGEEILAKLKSIRFVPVVFYTGYPAKVDHLKNLIVRVVAKGDNIEVFRNEVKAVIDTKLLHLARYIEESSRIYMWQSIAKMSPEHQGKISNNDVALLLARQLANNLSQVEIKNILEADRTKINPLEMYLYPVEKQIGNPSDICTKSDGSYWIVLSAACDLENAKVDFVLIARVFRLSEHPLYQQWREEKAAYDKLDENEKSAKVNSRGVREAKGAIKKILFENISMRYQYLPNTFFLDDCVIDFQELVAFPKGELEELTAFCTLDTPYKEELIQKFANYYGRIGTPDYDKAALWPEIEDSLFG